MRTKVGYTGPMQFRNSISRLTIAGLLLAAACDKAPRVPDAFVGTWQSDEQLTLASMRQSDKVSAEMRAVFEDRFFGRLVVEFRATGRASYFAGADEVPEFEPYDILDSGPNYVTFRETGDTPGLGNPRTWYIDGDLIGVEIQEWGFVEFFRRVSPAE